MTKTIAGPVMTGVTINLPWYEQPSTPIWDGNNINSARPPSTEYFDADYPLTPAYDETNAIFFNSDAVGANDGSSYENGYTSESAALIALCARPVGQRRLYARGTFNIGNSAIVLSGLAEGFEGAGVTGQEFIFQADPVNGCNIISSHPTGEGGIEFGGQAHWICDGFNITGGGRIFSYFPGGSSAGGCDHMTFRNITGAMSIGGDNIGWLHMDSGGADYIGAFNCSVQGPANTGFSTNTAVIFLSRVVHWRVQNCVMSRSLTGFYYKHFEASSYIADQGFFKDNYVFDCGFLAIHTASKSCAYENNIIDGIVQVADDGGGDDGADLNTFNHNTITGQFQLSYNDSRAALANVLTNNIIEGQFQILVDQTLAASTNTSDYNLYGSTIRYQNTAGLSLTNWIALPTVPANQDNNSLAGTPTYTGGANPTTIAGFALSGGTGVNAASDGTDMGADVTTVGAAA